MSDEAADGNEGSRAEERPAEDGDVDGERDRRSSLKELADSVSDRSATGRAPDPDLNLADEGDSPGDAFEWPEVEADRDPQGEPVAAVDGASNVLVLGPLTGAHGDRNCVELLEGAGHGPRNLLFVTSTRTVAERWTTWRQYADGRPANLCVLSVGERTRGAAGSSVTTTRGGPETIRTETVSDASDLTRLGIAINRLLKEWEPNRYPTSVCLHSLTELLQYTDPQRLFRFIHILQGRLDSLDAVAHYHLYPDAHDDRTVAVFRTLFDTVVRVTEDGRLEVESTSD